jgi:hypothetical protein
LPDGFFDAIGQDVELPGGFFDAIKYRVTGEGRRLERKLDEARLGLEGMARRRKQLQDAVARLAARPNDPRVEEW